MLQGSRVGSRWSGQQVGHGYEWLGQHGQMDAWTPSEKRLTSDWGVADVGRVGKFAPHHEAALPDCYSAVSPFQGRG